MLNAGWDQIPSERIRAAAHQANAPPTHASKRRPSSSSSESFVTQNRPSDVFVAQTTHQVVQTGSQIERFPSHGRLTAVSGGLVVKQLIAYLLDNMILDFQGDLTLDMVREFLREDESREGRALLAKLVEDRGVSDMMITLADCLQDYLRTGINEEVLREQIRTYAES
jgi:hypothetical protein